jgi:flavin reductase (DIM6/NTAB) family NADH-FMN oxidoreductase RutF
MVGHTHRPIPHRTGQDPVHVPRGQAKRCYRIDTFAQAVRRKGRPPGRKAQVIEGFDLPPICCRFRGQCKCCLLHGSFIWPKTLGQVTPWKTERKGCTMFYEPKNGHGLPHNPFNAVVTPRPIGWIATRSAEGHDNLAPYSFFNAVAYEPPQVMFASTSAKPDRDGTKDSVANIRETGVFAVNVVEYSARDLMNQTSGPWDRAIDEFALAGVEKADCTMINCPRVAGSPATLECKLTQIVQLPGDANFAVFGEVIGVHLRDDCMVDGMFDLTTFNPLTRLGYQDYSVIREVFSLKPPGN